MWPWSAAQASGASEAGYQAHINTFAMAFLMGLEYAITYPKHAISITKDKNVGGDPDAKYVDQIAGVLLKLWERGGDTEPDIKKMAELAQEYSDDKTEALPITPTFDDQGNLKWEIVPKGKRVFDSWEEKYQEWQ